MHKITELRKYLLFIFFLSFLNLNYSVYYKCVPSFYYKIPITITDEQYRAIPNAYVSIYYQLSGTISDEGGKIYVYTPEKKTNKGGKVNITIRNEELTESRLDCNFKVRVRLYEREFYYEYNLEEIPKTLLIKIPASKLKIEIKDQNLNPLEGKAVIGNDVLQIKGSREVFVANGNLEILVAHGKSKKLYGINIEEDMTLTTIFNYKKITIASYDQDGKALKLKVKWENKTYSGYGEVSLDIPEGRYTISLDIEGKIKNLDINTEVENYYKIIIDKKPPKIESFAVKQEEEQTIITTKVIDEGKFASGVKRVVAEISFEDGTYLVRELEDLGGGIYEANVEKVGEFDFRLIAYDKEGNKVIAKGSHIITYEDKPLESKEREEDDFLPIIIGIIVIGLIGGGIYIKKKLNEMEEV